MWVAGAAGHVEPGETALAAAAREACEELGIGIASHAIEPAAVMQRTDGTEDPIEQPVDWFFTAGSWSGDPQIMEPRKCADIAWFTLTDLPEAMPAYERIVLDGLASGRLDRFTAFGF